MPDELWAEVASLVPPNVDEVYGRPEHTTRLDKFSRARQHDLLACVRRGEMTTMVLGIEAKACEDFDGLVADRASAAAPSKKRARCNLLARALFGRPVFDEKTGSIIDEGLSQHGYQLWTAAAGTILEAQQRGVDDALLVIHEFVPRDIAAAQAAGDLRNWPSALKANAEALAAFVAALHEAGSESHETDFVRPGTALRVVKVQSFID